MFTSIKCAHTICIHIHKFSRRGGRGYQAICLIDSLSETETIMSLDLLFERTPRCWLPTFSELFSQHDTVDVQMQNRYDTIDIARSSLTCAPVVLCVCLCMHVCVSPWHITPPRRYCILSTSRMRLGCNGCRITTMRSLLITKSRSLLLRRLVYVLPTPLEAVYR